MIWISDDICHSCVANKLRKFRLILNQQTKCLIDPLETELRGRVRVRVLRLRCDDFKFIEYNQCVHFINL